MRCAGLQEDLFSAATSATVEDPDPVQRLYTHVADVLCSRAGNGLHACDTHISGYPTNPNCHRMDLVVCSVPKPAHGSVSRLQRLMTEITWRS